MNTPKYSFSWAQNFALWDSMTIPAPVDASTYQEVSTLTSSRFIEESNRRFIDALKRQEATFIRLVLSLDFEDGYINDAISYVLEKLEQNSFATCLWLMGVFEQYSDSNSVCINIRYAILKTIAYVNKKDCFEYIKGPLCLCLEAVLKSNIKCLQDAALMVIETWQDEEALRMLSGIEFTDDYIRAYAQSLLHKDKGEASS